MHYYIVQIDFFIKNGENVQQTQEAYSELKLTTMSVESIQISPFFPGKGLSVWAPSPYPSEPPQKYTKGVVT